MFASTNLQQFQSNPDNQEIINLQQNYASLEKRLDDLQNCTSTTDVATKMESIKEDIKSLQRQMDNAGKSGRQEVKVLQENFNQLKASVMKSSEALSQKINIVGDLIQANTDRDNITECFLHLDGRRCQQAAAVADEMTTDAVEELIKKYCNPNNKHQEGTKQVLSEFIDYMKDRNRRNSFKSLLNSLVNQTCVSHPPLNCYGRQCATCGRCCDWQYTGHMEDWKWIRNFRNWDHNTAERWRNGSYYGNFVRKDGAHCTRSSLYGVSRFVRLVSFGTFDGSALLNHLCVCDP